MVIIGGGFFPQNRIVCEILFYCIDTNVFLYQWEPVSVYMERLSHTTLTSEILASTADHNVERIFTPWRYDIRVLLSAASVSWLVGRSVGRLVGRSVCLSAYLLCCLSAQ